MRTLANLDGDAEYFVYACEILRTHMQCFTFETYVNDSNAKHVKMFQM